jgi:cytochrome c biogenesis protein CcdA
MSIVLMLTASAGLIAAFNPPTLSVMIMSINSLVGSGKKKRHITLHTLLFTIGVLLNSILTTVAFTILLNLLPIHVVGYVAVVFAFMLCFMGLMEAKDYFWYGKGWSSGLTKHAEGVVHAWTKRHHSYGRGLVLGGLVSLKLLPYSTAIMVAVCIISRFSGSDHYSSVFVWSISYVLPLLFITALTFSGVQGHALLAWKEQSKHGMRLAIGILYILTSWIILGCMSGGLRIL